MGRYWPILLLLLIFSCSKDREELKSKVKISFNYEKDQNSNFLDSKSISTSNSNWGLVDPTSISEFNCFGIFVSYPEESPNSCSTLSGNVVLRPHQMGGLISSSGVINMELDSGPGRKFTVVGFKDSDGACPGVHQMSDNEKSYMSAPFILGSKTQDLIPGINEIDINASFGGSTKFEECAGPLFGWGSGGDIVDPTFGLVGHWKFNGTTGLQTDLAGVANNFTFPANGMPTANGLNLTTGADFDNATSTPAYLSLSISGNPELDVSGSSKLSFSVWIKWTTAPTVSSYQYIIESFNGNYQYYVYYDQTNAEILFRVWDSGADYIVTKGVPLNNTLDNVVLNQWIHIAGVYDADVGMMSLYVDGQSASLSGAMGPIYSITSVLYVGDSHNGSEKVSGIMENLRIWKARAITPYDVGFIINNNL